MNQRGRVEAQPAYVLHTYPFRETSLLVEVFSRDFGRMALLARGARRPRSALRGLLMQFQPLALSWSGKGEVLTLTKAEWQGGVPLLDGRSLLCGFYLNELLMNLLPREDAHTRLFARYETILKALSEQPEAAASEIILRRFEKALLQELGYGLTLDHDFLGQPIEGSRYYRYGIEEGAHLLQERDDAEQAYLGKTFLDLEAESLADPASRREAKRLMRRLINHYLAGKELETRKLFKELIDP